jgi:murein DD-endopeptidase MepM/ murein hydrolase activator NlpD
VRVLAATVLALAMLLPGAPAGAEEEFDATRRKANQLAAELAGAQTRLAELEVEMASLEARAAEGESRRRELEAVVRDQAVERFMRNTSPPLPILVDDDLNQLARANALARFVTLDTQAAVDEYRRAGDDLQATRNALEARQVETRAAVADFRDRAEQVNAELQRLQRLEDERRAREEAQRRADEERRAREDAERRAAEEAPISPPGQERAAPPSTGRAPQVSSAAAPPPTRRPATTTRRPAPAPATTRPAPAPAPATTRPAPASGGGGWLCPVQGPRAFSNDWGQPRSGGRRHQGNDILSPRGTPVVASVSGTVRPHNSSLGGLSYYLKGDDGNTYFGTHLDTLSGASGRVAQGAVLGTVGDSGNARGGPTHLHFEIHPGGGAPVNPYPTLAQHC